MVQKASLDGLGSIECENKGKKIKCTLKDINDEVIEIINTEQVMADGININMLHRGVIFSGIPLDDDSQTRDYFGCLKVKYDDVKNPDFITIENSDKKFYIDYHTQELKMCDDNFVHKWRFH